MYYPTGMGALGCCGGAMPMGADDGGANNTSSPTARWVMGGILVGLAVFVFWEDPKGKLTALVGRS